MKDIRPQIPMPIEDLRLAVGYKSRGGFGGVVSGRVQAGFKLAIAIEEATDKAVMRGDLRPDLWPDHVTPAA